MMIPINSVINTVIIAFLLFKKVLYSDLFYFREGDDHMTLRIKKPLAITQHMNECMHFIQKQCLCVSMPVSVYINDTL